MASIAPLLQTGIAIVAATTSFAGRIKDFQPPGLSVVVVDVTATSDTKTAKLPGVVKTWGPVNFTISHDPNDDPDTHTGIIQTFTITYPKKVSGSSSGATKVFSGFIQSITTQETPIDGEFLDDVVIEITGDVTCTDEA